MSNNPFIFANSRANLHGDMKNSHIWYIQRCRFIMHILWWLDIAEFGDNDDDENGNDENDYNYDKIASRCPCDMHDEHHLVGVPKPRSLPRDDMCKEHI